LARFISLKIDGAVVRYTLAVNMARLGNVNADAFTSAKQNEMLCTLEEYERDEFLQKELWIKDKFVVSNITFLPVYTAHHIILLLSSPEGTNFLYLTNRKV
jgi:hypothetical protein